MMSNRLTFNDELTELLLYTTPKSDIKSDFNKEMVKILKRGK